MLLTILSYILLAVSVAILGWFMGAVLQVELRIRKYRKLLAELEKKGAENVNN